jgi:hypothetical protein
LELRCLAFFLYGQAIVFSGFKPLAYRVKSQILAHPVFKM